MLANEKKACAIVFTLFVLHDMTFPGEQPGAEGGGALHRGLNRGEERGLSGLEGTVPFA